MFAYVRRGRILCLAGEKLYAADVDLVVKTGFEAAGELGLDLYGEVDADAVIEQGELEGADGERLLIEELDEPSEDERPGGGGDLISPLHCGFL